jgi:hypothetical protein
VLIEVTPPNFIAEVLNAGFFGTVNYLLSRNYRVRQSALNILQKIALHQTQVFLIDHNFTKAAPELFKILELQQNDEKTLVLKFSAC